MIKSPLSPITLFLTAIAFTAGLGLVQSLHHPIDYMEVVQRPALFLLPLVVLAGTSVIAVVAAFRAIKSAKVES